MNQLSRLIQAGRRVLLVGPPATGKTSRVHQAAEECGYELMTYCAGLGERPDLAGCYVPDIQAGITRALPLEMLDTLLKTEKKTLLLLDDLGQGPIDVQAAIKSQMTRGGTLRRNPNVLIWGATNRPGDKAGVIALCEPLRSEFHMAFAIATPTSEDKPDGAVFLHTWKEEVERWCDWAMDNNSPAEVVAWHRSTTGRTLYQWKPHADPAIRFGDFRSWGDSLIPSWNDGMHDLHTISACVGKPVAAEFLAFASLADKLPTPDQVRIDPKGAPVPSDPAALYLVASMLATSATPKDAAPFCTYLARLPRVFGALLGRDMYRKLGAKLSGAREWVSWFTENQSLFTV